MLLKDGSGQILGIRHLPQKQNRLILLCLSRKQVTQLRCISQTYGKYPDRIRVQGTCMADFFLAAYATQLRHHIMGGKARFLIYIQHAVLHHFLLRRPAVFLYVRTDC